MWVYQRLKKKRNGVIKNGIKNVPVLASPAGPKWPQHHVLMSSGAGNAEKPPWFPCIILGEIFFSCHSEIGKVGRRSILLYFPLLFPVASEVCLSKAPDARSSWDLIRNAVWRHTCCWWTITSIPSPGPLSPLTRRLQGRGTGTPIT